MKRCFYKEMWSYRFNKMLKLEKQGVVDYQNLLAEIEKRYPGHGIIPHLQKLIADEKNHALLVGELVQILERQTV